MHHLLWRSLRMGAAMAAGVSLWAQSADPLYQTKGDHQRSYKFLEGNIDSPYRVYVPDAWSAGKRMPLVVMLHGGGLTHDAPFDREPEGLKGVLKAEADRHGFVLVGVEGYKGGAYGSAYPLPLSQVLRGFPPPQPAGDHPIDPTAPEVRAGPPPGMSLDPVERAKNDKLAELDVLNVIGIVSKEYNTDPARLYLMGNSMGMLGTLSLAAKHTEMFTAIGPSDGPVDPTSYPYQKLKGLAGVMIVHGEKDPVAPIDDSEVIAFLIKAQGIDTQFLRVPGGGHGDSWYRALPKIFDFFDEHSHR